MNCERAVELLTGGADAASEADRRAADDHVSRCADCRGAVMSVHALRLAGLVPVPPHTPDAVERAVAVAAGSGAGEKAPAGRFWLGVGVGAALAASLAVAIVVLAPMGASVDPTATPLLQMAVNEARDVDISLTTPEVLIDAEIHVTLSGAIGLGGYAEQRELRWRTDLDAGTNRLTLPIVATGEAGGQVVVEVIHAGKRRTFLVDVRTRV